jgi:hypothetical protein
MRRKDPGAPDVALGWATERARLINEIADRQIEFLRTLADGATAEMLRCRTRISELDSEAPQDVYCGPEWDVYLEKAGHP